MEDEHPKRLPERDPISMAAVGISFFLLIGWFVWTLLSPPVLRVSPALRAEPIPRDFGLVIRYPRRAPVAPGGRRVPSPFEAPTRPPGTLADPLAR